MDTIKRKPQVQRMPGCEDMDNESFLLLLQDYYRRGDRLMLSSSPIERELFYRFESLVAQVMELEASF